MIRAGRPARKETLQKWRDNQADNGHNIDQNVHRWAGCILEGVAHGVTDNNRSVGLGTLATQIAFLDKLLGIIPGAAGIGHHQSHQDTAEQRAAKHAAQ